MKCSTFSVMLMAGFCRKRPRMQEGHFNEKNGIKTRGLLPSIHLPSWALNLLPCASPREYIWSFIHISVQGFSMSICTHLRLQAPARRTLNCSAVQNNQILSQSIVLMVNGTWCRVRCYGGIHRSLRLSPSAVEAENLVEQMSHFL